jgi:hypothetical protein
MSTLVKEKTSSVKDALIKTGQDVGKKLAIASAYITCWTAYAMSNEVFAIGNQNAQNDPKTVVIAVVDVIVKIFPFVGIFFVIAGIFKLIMAYRNDQPEAQAGAARDIVIGAVFIAFTVFAWKPIKTAIGV